MRALRVLLIVVPAVAGVILAAGTAVVIGVRSGDERFLRAYRRFQRDSANPMVMRTAGTPGSSTGIIEHTGRRTGRIYRTPVRPFRDGDGWSVAVYYGADSNWVRNVVAAEGSVLQLDGRRMPVGRGELVPVAHTALAGQRVVNAIWGIRQAVHLPAAD